MRVLISTEIKELAGYVVYNHITGVTWVNVDTLIFHSCVEEGIEKVMALSSLPSYVTTRIYINSKIDSLLFYLFTGIGGYIYSDTSFLADKDSLDFLVETAGDMGCEVTTATENFESVTSFLDTLTNGNVDATKLLNNKNWIDTLNVAITGMQTSLSITDQCSKDIVEFMDNTMRHITDLENQNKKTGQEIQKLRDTINNLNVKQIGSQVMSGGPMRYGTYTVPSIVKNVVYIRCFGDVNYLSTFILAFQGWLGASRNGKNLASKVLIVRPQFSSYMTRYNKIPKITSQSAGMLDIKKSNAFVTFEPNKKVMDAYFKDTNIPVFFVIDFMQSDVPLLSGHMIKTFNAYSSPSAYTNMASDRNRAPLARSFFSVDAPKGCSPDVCFTLPYIPDYLDMSETERRQTYFKYCRNLYSRLYDIIMGV